MRLTAVIVGLLIICLWAKPGHTDIYVWIDDDGVRNFTNHNPPPDSEILMHLKEQPDNETNDGDFQNQTDAQRQLIQARTQLRRNEERFAEQQAEMERRIAEAERRAAEALRRAEQLEDSIDHRFDTDTGPSPAYVYYPHTFKYRHHQFSRNKSRHKVHQLGKGHHRFRRHKYKIGRHFNGRFKRHRHPPVKNYGFRDHHPRKRHFVTGPLRTRPFVGNRTGITRQYRGGFKR